MVSEVQRLTSALALAATSAEVAACRHTENETNVNITDCDCYKLSVHPNSPCACLASAFRLD